MKIEYAKLNTYQLSDELVSLVFTRVMEQASKERATMDATESLWNEKGICNRCMKASYRQPWLYEEET